MYCLIIIVNKVVLAVGPADVLIIVCSCEIMPIEDASVLDSWVDNLPVISGDFFWWVVSWVDDCPRASRGRCNYVLSFPLG